MINLNLKCECGESTVVSEASAGARLRCDCGRTIKVPPLHELRKRAGLTAIPETIPETIRRKVNSGEIPSSRACANCQMQTAQTISVSAICEQSWSKESATDASMVDAIVSGLKFLISGTTSWLVHAGERSFEDEQVEREHHGRDVIITLPLPLCESCDSAIPSARQFLTWPRNALLIAAVTSALLFWYAWGIVFLAAGISIAAFEIFLRVSRNRKLRALVASEIEYEDLLRKYPKVELRTS